MIGRILRWIFPPRPDFKVLKSFPDHGYEIREWYAHSMSQTWVRSVGVHVTDPHKWRIHLKSEHDRLRRSWKA